MTILLANDDGYRSEGIKVLEEVLSSHGHEVWVCAPSSERSACSHSMTLRTKITATRYGKNHYHLDGYPSDCVLYSVKGKLFPHEPDLVIAGINHGYNISTDTIYSGTIGAAEEGVLCGLPSIAISCQKDEEGKFPFHASAEFLSGHLEDFMSVCSTTAFVSVNVPPHPSGAWSPSTLGYLDYNDVFLANKTEEKQVYEGGSTCFGSSIILELKGSKPCMESEGIDTDFRKVEKGIISVSVLSVLPSIDRNGQEKLICLSEEHHG
jgi:5'-nucleotidase